jgi:hypothetical protein
MYTRMLDRWWPALVCLGLALFALAWPFYNDLYGRLTEPWRWRTLIVLGAGVILVAFLMLAFRKGAYVQPMADHLRLVTPFLRMNVSYRRIRRTTTANVSTLFPRRRLSALRRDIIEPFLGDTAVIVELNALPLPAASLRLFLSPFFFKDETPHLVLLIRDWMRLSTELDSLRIGGDAPAPVRRNNDSILARLPKN